MKAITVSVVALVVIIAGLTYMNMQELPSYVKSQVEVKTEVIVEKELDKRITEAQENAKADIEAKAQAAYDETYSQAMDEIKLKAIKEYRAEIEQMETDLSKKVGEY